MYKAFNCYASLIALLIGGTLFASSVVPASAGDLVPPRIQSTSPAGVNLGSGAYNFSNTDISIGTLTLNRFFLAVSPNVIDARYTYNFFGKYMTHNFDIYAAPNVHQSDPPYYPATYSTPEIHTGEGSSGSFYTDFGSLSSGQPFTFWSGESTTGELSITGVNGIYRYYDQQGARYDFSGTIFAKGVKGGFPAAAERATSITYPDGRIVSLTYDSNSNLKVVSDNYGFALVFDYNGTGQVQTVCGYNLSLVYVTVSTTCAAATIKTTYTYGTYLNSYTDVLGQVTNYANQNGLLTCIEPPGYTTCKVANSPNAVVVYQQTLGDGTVWNYSYTGDNYDAIMDEDYVPTNGDNQVWMTDPNSKVSNYVFTKSTPYQFTDANGHTTNYRFTGESTPVITPPGSTPPSDGDILKEIDLPEGGQYLEEHFGPYSTLSKQTWKAKSGSGLADIVIQKGYGSCPSTHPHPACTNPAWVKDGKGNETDYTYDAGHGGVLTETDPADANGVRPQKRYSYTAMYAKVLNASGSLVNAAGPIYKLTAVSTCASATAANPASCVGTAAETVTTYTYNNNNLLMTSQSVAAGDNSVSATTAYGYDSYGNQVSVDGPLPGTVDQSFTTYDLAHRPIFEIGVDPDGTGPRARLVIKHTYDIDGRETLTQTGTGNTITFVNGVPTGVSDFVVVRFKRMTYDAMDRVIKTEVGVP